MSEKKPQITRDISYYWDCPECDETNSAECDGDTFGELKCEHCNEKFKDYEEDF